MEPPSDQDIESQYERAVEVFDDGYRDSKTKREEAETAHLLLTKRLVWELNELRDSIDLYRKWSRMLTVALLVVAIVQLYLNVSG